MADYLHIINIILIAVTLNVFDSNGTFLTVIVPFNWYNFENSTEVGEVLPNKAFFTILLMMCDIKQLKVRF